MSFHRVTNEAFVTLVSSDNTAIGALTLAHSLRHVNTNRQLCVLITGGISESLRTCLHTTFDHVELVEGVSCDERPELQIAFQKLNCWRLIQYTKCVFLDADCFVVKNVDDLFERDEFAAAADVGWPDCFNTGVFVYRPSLDTYKSLIAFSLSHGSTLDGSDHGLLNAYFKSWSTSEASKRLPFLYNMTTNVSYTYAPAFKQFNDQVRIVHFIGSQKPWYYTFNQATQRVTGHVVQHESQYVNEWWKVFAERVYPTLSDDIRDRLKTQYVDTRSHASSTSSSTSSQQQQHSNEINFSQFIESAAHGNQQQQSGGVIVGSSQHQGLWEQGCIDYTGRDSFDNILAHMDAKLKE